MKLFIYKVYKEMFENNCHVKNYFFERSQIYLERVLERERNCICTQVGWRRLVASSHDGERLLSFRRGGVYGKPDRDSVLQWECPERLLRRGADMCWAGTQYTAARPARGKD